MRAAPLLGILALLAGGSPALPEEGAQHTPVLPALPALPDIELVDQDGRPVHVYSDLVRGKRVAINFVFTTCTTICPPMGANFERLQALLGARAGADVRLISVSVDPQTDTPQRLKAWGTRFHAGSGWSLLTGRKEDVDRLLKALGVFTPDPASHAPVVVLGNDAVGRWTRAYGLTPPARLVQLLDGLTAPSPAGTAGSAPAGMGGQEGARKYFTDVELIDQDGRPRRLYSDLLAGKTVVIDAFFSGCTGSCPVMAANLARLQAALAGRLGSDLHLLSISVDPQTDTPARLKEYARRFGARPGWYFLTGSKSNVDFALRKLGQYAEQKEAHTNILIVGNERTGLWKKVFGLSKAEEILAIVEGVLDDRGAPAPGG
ncbi:MAG TPA: SCO family protein [Thermoanaerobaculia bacterium]|nr:SCO family protein [Thermoanaerobaculia bacterium]